MRLFVPAAVIASSFFMLQSLGVASAAGWEPATATNVSAGAGPSAFIVEASVTLPQMCYTARIRSTPIALHSTRSFYIEQMAPSSKCSSSSAYKCTVVSPAFPLPIPHIIDVYSKGPQKWKITVAVHEPSPAPPICRKS
jgi:hypothetical protein